ncbi:MAG: ATP-binding protein, partial [Cyanobacteriota bacterium]
GWYGESDRQCSCGEGERRRYWGRLSGPLLDRIDLQVVVRRPEACELAGIHRRTAAAAPMEGSAAVAARVQRARARMERRNPGGACNAQLSAAELAQVLNLEEEALHLWEQALECRRLTARGAQRALRVARTISDLVAAPQVSALAIAEALAYRSFDGL